MSDALYSADPSVEQPSLPRVAHKRDYVHPCLEWHVATDQIAAVAGRYDVSGSVANLVVDSVQCYFDGGFSAVRTSAGDQVFNLLDGQVIVKIMAPIIFSGIFTYYLGPKCRLTALGI